LHFFSKINSFFLHFIKFESLETTVNKTFFNKEANKGLSLDSSHNFLVVCGVKFFSKAFYNMQGEPTHRNDNTNFREKVFCYCLNIDIFSKEHNTCKVNGNCSNKGKYHNWMEFMKLHINKQKQNKKNLLLYRRLKFLK